MTTHRSLNKLEYKAHMSIHNVAEVNMSGNESHEAGYTRDRLGRSHKLFDGDGTSRIFKPATSALAMAVLFLSAVAAHAIPENVRVSTDDFEQKSLDDRLGQHEPEEKFAIYRDTEKTIGFNENGDPNVGMRF